MISIVMAYWNRRAQLKRTLDSLMRSAYKDIEIIVVDDGSSEEERVEDLQSSYPLRVIRIEPKDKYYRDSCIPFNMGFLQVNGDKVVIQNPESLHYTDNLSFIDKNLNDSNYFSFACYSLAEDQTLCYNPNETLVFRPGDYGDYPDYLTRREGWFNHARHRITGYHFAAAITTKNLKEIKGFDERYQQSIGFGDTEFLIRVKRKGLSVVITDETNMVLHQHHIAREFSWDFPNHELKAYSMSLLNQTNTESYIAAPENKVFNG